MTNTISGPPQRAEPQVTDFGFEIATQKGRFEYLINSQIARQLLQYDPVAPSAEDVNFFRLADAAHSLERLLLEKTGEPPLVVFHKDCLASGREWLWLLSGLPRVIWVRTHLLFGVPHAAGQEAK